jgi:DegV family protein with EDD domain
MIEALKIRWVPYYIHRGKEVLRDLITAQRSSFYQWLATAQELPKTASPGPGDYVELYEAVANAEGATAIVSIHMTAEGSGGYQAARVAASMIGEERPELKIAVVDTRNVAMCQGWMAVEAARAAQQGKSLADIVALVERMIPITRMLQTADTLKYLYMGGRVGRAKHLVGSVLNIKPIISVEDGMIVAVGTARGRHKAYQLIADKVEQTAGRMGKIKVAYVHAAALEEVAKLKELVEGRVTCVESIVAELSPALGVHSGPGTAGLCYYPVS